MPIDFFIAPCAKIDGNCKKIGIVCKTETTSERFGISDVNSSQRQPAFIDTTNEIVWDVVVKNTLNKNVIFKAVDFCVDAFRDNGELIKRCEGFLFFDNKILFIELKKRAKGNWLKDAREKFEETILKFRENYANNNFEILEPIVSNKMFSRVHQNEMLQKRILKDNVGLDFHISSTIKIT